MVSLYGLSSLMKNEGMLQLISTTKHLLLFYLSQVCCSVPQLPQLLPCLPCPVLTSASLLVLPDALFPPSPVLALRHQPRSCPTLSAPTELWPLPTTLPPHILHLTLDFYIKGVHLLEQHSLKKSNESQTDNFIRVISSKLKLLPITKSSLSL